jgi:hypothetical protein
MVEHPVMWRFLVDVIGIPCHNSITYLNAKARGNTVAVTMAERPSALSIAVCALIALYSDSSSPLNEVEHEEKWEEQLSAFLQGFVLGDFIDHGLVSFMHQVVQTTDQQTSSILLDCLERSCSSVDALVDLFGSLQSSVVDGTIDGASAHGVQVRKTCLGFDELSFEGTTRLWQALNDQVLEISSITPVELIEEEKSPKYDSQQAAWPLSPEQIEAILRKQCVDLEGTDHSFEKTEVEIRRILACNPELPLAHFLRFLNCLRHGERVGALDSLHQYFDYAMIKERKEAPSADQPSLVGRNIFQYAAILLAALHSSFGDANLSLKATEEAVRVAQQSGDPACVAYAIGWLYCNQTGMDAGELLRRCSSRASEEHLRPLVAGANISLARHLLGAETTSAASCWTSLLDATTDPPPSSTTVALDRPTHMADIASSEEAMALLSRQILVGAGVWESFGLNGLSGLTTLVDLQCYSEHMSAQEIASAVTNLACVSLCGPAPGRFDLMDDDDLAGTTGSTPSFCRYATALNILIRLHENQKATDTTYSVALVLHEWAVRRGDLGHAEFLSGLLHSFLHPRMSNYNAAYVETMSQHVLLLSRQGRWEKAKHLAKELCETCQREGGGLRVQHASLLIQLAIIHLDSSPHNFIGALPPLLECLSMCEKHAMDSNHATALSVLAQVQMRMRNTKQAIALLNAALPSLLQHTHIWFAGEASLTLGKCHLQRANEAQPKGHTAVIHILRSAITSLEMAECRMRECQDAVRLREVYYLLARTYNSIPGKLDKRNDASQRFVNVSRHLEKASHTWPRGSLTDINYLEALASRSAIDV